MQNQTSPTFQFAQNEIDGGDGHIIIDTPIGDVSSSESQLTGEDAVSLLHDKYPELDHYLDQLNVSDDTSIQDILTSIQDLANNAGDTNTDVTTIEISTVNYGTLFIEQLADLTIPVAENDARIVIESYGKRLLDNIYTPGLDGLVHLDLREFVFDNTAIAMSDNRHNTGEDGYLEQDGSGLILEISVTHGSTTDQYELWVNAFRSEAVTKMSDIDRIDIPTDALIPLTIFRENDLHNASVNVHLVSAGRRTFLHTGYIGDGDGYLVTTDIPVSRLPYRMGEPFYLEFKIQTGKTWISSGWVYSYKTVRTPIYRVTNAPAQQYLFLNDYGHFDIIPMHGTLTLAPEYDIENAFRTNAVERAKATKRTLYTQNTGALSRATAVALSELLLSRRIFHYTPGGALRRIVVEAPTVNISTKNSINTATFSWRYADNKQ